MKRQFDRYVQFVEVCCSTLKRITFIIIETALFCLGLWYVWGHTVKLMR
jgi:hypothetical protein